MVRVGYGLLPLVGTGTENAPICWVIPPASPFATDVDRRVSNSVVLPWSTCPMIVTTGGRSGKVAGSGWGGLRMCHRLFLRQQTSQTHGG